MEMYQVINNEAANKKIDGSGIVEVYIEEDLLLLAKLVIDPDCALNRDIHPSGEEGYYVLNGELTVCFPEKKIKKIVKTGEVLFVPRNEYHIVRNDGTIRVSAIAAIGGKVN